MSIWPRSPALRSVALGAAVLLALLFLHRTAGIMASSAPGDPLSKLSVSVRQSSASPPTLSVKVANGNKSPVTVLNWESPLDPAALALGLVKITPAGADSPLELPTIMFRRVMPPGPDSLVTIEPGTAVEREIVLEGPVVDEDQIFPNGQPARVVLKGSWTSVWPLRQDDISRESLEKTAAADDSFTGDFESNEVELKRES